MPEQTVDQLAPLEKPIEDEEMTFILKDKGGMHNIDCHFWWNDRGIKETVLMEMNGDRAEINIKDLYQLLFLIGTPEQQVSLVESKESAVREYEQTIDVFCPKDMKKGEAMRTKVKFCVPESEIIIKK